MAARKRKYLTESHKAKIRTSQLINRLQRFALNREKIARPGTLMSDGQIRAALGLLKKTLPDLSAQQVSGGLDLKTQEECLDELD